MTPTEELRAAAARMRTFTGPAAEPTATLLDKTAEHIEFGSGGPGNPLIDATIDMARAINGGVQR